MRLGRLNRMVVTGMLLFLFLGPVAAELAAQTAELPRRTETINWTSGSHDGNPQGSDQDPPELVHQDMIYLPGVPWMQLQFRRGRLGRLSFIEITSLADGATQRLDATRLAEWGNRSAFFNGDAVEVSLFVGARERAVSIDVPEVVVGELGPPAAKSICGVDNRVASNEQRVGRIDPIGCTGWIIGSGQLLSAGHCLAGGSLNQTLSFNVPPSLPDGTVQFPPPQDQYSINQSSFVFVNGGVGNDWGIFAVFNNSQTGLQPIAAQGSFSVKQDLGPANIRITGFGVDSGTTNQTNQTHVGPNAGSSGTTMRYVTDTTGGNSGSPVIDEATGMGVGIHTHGGCTSSGGNNFGTSFFNSALWNAIDTGTPFQIGIETFDHVIRTVGLTGFSDPVVVLGPPSFNGTDPSTTRVRNVTATSFQHNLQEWDYLDGTHGNTDEVGYLAVERSTTSLGSLPAVAGTVTINHNWTPVTFSQSFSGAPVVITQVGTFNGNQAVTTRLRNVSASGFEIRLQEEEANDGTHNPEVVHWIAVSPGSTTTDGHTIVVGTQSGVTHNFATIGFGQALANPVFLADMQTFAGNNPATLRYQNLSTTSVQVKVEEEQSLDAEVGHVGEVVGFIAISR